MSVDHKAYAVIGYKIPREAFLTNKKQDKCRCGQEFNGTEKFCSECGLRANTIITDHSLLDDILSHREFNGFKIGFDTDYNHIYVGIVAEYPCHPNIVELDFDRLRSLRDRLDVIVPSQNHICEFGLHAVLHVSY